MSTIPAHPDSLTTWVRIASPAAPVTLAVCQPDDDGTITVDHTLLEQLLTEAGFQRTAPWLPPSLRSVAHDPEVETPDPQPDTTEAEPTTTDPTPAPTTPPVHIATPMRETVRTVGFRQMGKGWLHTDV